MDEIEKNKNGKCLRICPLTSPDEDELIKRLSKILKHPNGTGTENLIIVTMKCGQAAHR